MKRLSSFLIFVLLCTAPAWAAPAFRQAAACGATTTVSFAGAPTNGDAVAGIQMSGGGGTPGTMQDSNAVTYTDQQTQASGLGDYGYLADNRVAGSPTAAYSFSSGASNTQCIYDISGVAYPGTYTGTSSAASVSSITMTLAGVKSTDALICGAANTVGNISSVVINNGTNTNDNVQGFAYASHSIATSTASTTCVVTFSTPTAGVAAVFADYTAPTSASGTLIAPWIGAYAPR